MDEKLPEQQVIVPRKGVLELQRLLSGDGDLEIELGSESRPDPARRHSLYLEAD